MVNIIVNIVGQLIMPGGIAPPTPTLITTDSTAYTIDTTTLYTVDNNNTTI